MAVTTDKIKQLRQMTGAGMIDCKNALVEAGGDIDKAVKVLREKGLAAAAKKAGRIASEGIVEIAINDDETKGIVVEVNCETDFVAINEDFKAYVSRIAEQILKSSTTNLDEFLKEKWIDDDSVTVEEAVSQKIAIIGENITIRRFGVLEHNTKDIFASYIHGGGKMGVLLQIQSEIVNDTLREAGKNICMQIAAMYPKYISRDDIPEDFIESEREILRSQALKEGKPEKIVDKMVAGRLNKQLQEYCLLEQAYVKDGEITVKQYLENIGKEIGSEVTLKEFICYERGEGIEKKEEDFAAEVQKAMDV